MRVIFPEEMEKLKEVFEPYMDYSVLPVKLADNAPDEAVEALKKYKEIGNKLFIV